MIDIHTIMAQLATSRRVFYSEADFQHALAWEIQRQVLSISIRLEYPPPFAPGQEHIDVWVIDGGTILAIELKYKTRALTVDVVGEEYSLKDQSAHDQGRYDFFKDVQRVEQVAASHKGAAGCALLLTNDSAYWKPSTRLNPVDKDFRLENGRVVSGLLKWGKGASANTKKGREAPIQLRNTYTLRWMDYSRPSTRNYGEFRYLLLQV